MTTPEHPWWTDKTLTADQRCCAWIAAQAFGAVNWAHHPHLKLRDLSDRMQVEVGEHVRDMLCERDRRGSTLTDAQVYLAALEHMGVDCPHAPLAESRYYEDPLCVLECRNCGTVVFVDDPQKNHRMLMIAASLAGIGRPAPMWSDATRRDTKAGG